MRNVPRLSDDGLPTPEVGAWAERKHALIVTYARIFATGMKRKWDYRYCVDLFAGAGRSRIQGTQLVIPAPPLLLTELADPFDLHVFCDIDRQKLEALKTRIEASGCQTRCEYIVGDSNDSHHQIVSTLKSAGGRSRFLTFCLVDPYKLEDLAFSTIESLSSLCIDFLILIPSYMDANRNVKRYCESAECALDRFLGTRAWRHEWDLLPHPRMDFGVFVASTFGNRMKDLGYKYDGPQSMVLVRSADKNLPLYHLSFFSRSPVGVSFWRKARKYSQNQISMFD